MYPSQRRRTRSALGRANRVDVNNDLDVYPVVLTSITFTVVIQSQLSRFDSLARIN